MCEDPVRTECSMVSIETHESQDLVVPGPAPDQTSPSLEIPGPAGSEPGPPRNPEGLNSGLNPETMTQGPVNAITVLTLLDKLVNMLDTVQENQHKMEVRQAEMEGVVLGIQADMTKLSKSHSHTSNTVSKLLDKSRKVSVTMKEVRDKMERQGIQVKKLEANHAHLLKRNNFKVLIFQEENEIPSSVFVKEPVPYPRDKEEGGEELNPAVLDANRSQEEGLHTIDLSSDEDVGLEAELEDEVEGLQDLEHMDKSRAEKIKRSSLKKVDSLKKAFSRQNIEKKMNKIVSQEQRDKIKKSLTPTQHSFKVSPLTFSMRKGRGGSESHPAEAADPQALTQTGDLPVTEAHIQLSPLGSPDHDLPFTQVHSQLAPLEQEEGKQESAEREELGGGAPGAEEELGGGEPGAEELPESFTAEVNVSGVLEEVSKEYALSATLPQESSYIAPCEEEEEEEKGEGRGGEKEKEEEEKGEGRRGEKKEEEEEEEKGLSS